MRSTIGAAALLAAALGACAAIPTEPVRVNEGPADLSTCRRLGPVGETVRADAGAAAIGLSGAVPGPEAILAESLAGWRQAALAKGATDILLSRRQARDWSYVEPIAYRCPH